MVKHGGSPIGSLAFEKSQKLRGYIPTYMYIYIYIYTYYISHISAVNIQAIPMNFECEALRFKRVTDR